MTTIRRLQHSLTVAPQSGDGFEVASERFAGRVRCGDFADVVHIDEQRCCALVVDGGGHGTPGIAQASALRAAFRAALASSEDNVLDASPAVAALNEWIARLPGRKVLPCTWVGIDMAAGKVAYINAGGMPPLLMVGAGRLVTLDQPSLVLGVDPEYVYQPTRVDVPEKFRLICCTDGLLEATGAGGEALGDQRLHEALLEQDAFGTADDVLQRLVDTWKTHLSGAHPDDDAVILIVARG